MPFESYLRAFKDSDSPTMRHILPRNSWSILGHSTDCTVPSKGSLFQISVESEKECHPVSTEKMRFIIAVFDLNQKSKLRNQ
jgi:hypothetical protein